MAPALDGRIGLEYGLVATIRLAVVLAVSRPWSA
jgi:hypothetical protein